MKVGVLVVAYNAESTLVDVLDRIPQSASLQLAEVLVRDDHSTDETHSVASAYLQRESHLNLTVIRHEENLGYGGNQKAGYLYALDHGWDVVVLLHGDGQYAPEIMGDIIEPIVHGDADAVFGSRMMERGRAREGGMPIYKYVGNRILSTTQNALTGLELSEWHSGYRAYRVSALADLPFVANSDGFDFDTEIILQLAAAKKKIVEVPIPTYYGDEICRVNGDATTRPTSSSTRCDTASAVPDSAPGNSATSPSRTRSNRRPTAPTVGSCRCSSIDPRSESSTSGAGRAGWPAR